MGSEGIEEHVMKKKIQSYKRRHWTVARLAALLAAGLEEGNRLDMAQAKKRYGVGLREILWLQRSLFGMLEDIGVNGAQYLSLDLEPDETTPGKYRVSSIAPKALERMTCLSCEDAMLASRALKGVVADKAFEVKLKEISAGVAAELGPMEERKEGLVYYLYSDPDQTRSKAELLAQAVLESRQVAFSYHKPDSPQAEFRQVWPLNLRRDQGSFRVLAWDPARKAQRVFVLERMDQVKVFQDKFAWPKGLNREKILRQDLSLYRPTGREVSVKLAMTGRAFLRYFGVGAKPKTKKLKDGWVEFSLKSALPEWVARTFLPYLPEVKVLSPEEFKNTWDSTIQEIAKKYR
jgi:predicted DNA-binding transcriptional regulator YafY